MNEPLFIVVDLFCGAGGTTTGFALAELEGQGIAKVIACVNHDPKAIESHWKNHPDVLHFNEDMRTLDLTGLKEIVAVARVRFPDAYVVLWASLECTNFSKAKGGQPRDADSRTLAEHLDRYIQAIDPEYIQIENVVEFMSWGPLDENGKPISSKNGIDWQRWRKSICDIGYYDEWQELNSANYGAYTSRNRLFGCFAKIGLPIAWPEPTHAKVKKATRDLFGASLKPWMPVKEVLDFADEGESIFTRAKALSDKTLERIYAGLLKYVAKGDKSFISKYYSGKPKGKVDSVDQPSATVTTFGNSSLVQTVGFTAKSVDEPIGTITTVDHHALVQGRFLACYYGNGHNISSVDTAAPTIVTKDRIALIQPQCFIDKHYGSNPQNQSIEQPAGTIVTNDKHRLIQCEALAEQVRVNCDCGKEFISTGDRYSKEPCPDCGGFGGQVTFLFPFIMPTNFDNKPKSIDEPAPTITANRKHHYLVNPSHGGHSTSTDAPCPVIVARQDKVPLYLVQVEGGPVAVEVYEGDSEIMIKIKQFMAAFGIVDIKMRMLRVHELLKIQGFPSHYQLVGNQADQKKFIGNSVVPQVVKAWCEAMGVRLLEHQSKKVA